MFEIYGNLNSQEIIVAIPALGERKEMYKPLADQLNSYKWVVFDLPGLREGRGIVIFCQNKSSTINLNRGLFGKAPGPFLIKTCK